jgi:hypothetical protein
MHKASVQAYYASLITQAYVWQGLDAAVHASAAADLSTALLH